MERKLNQFQYFVECYFTISMDYSDLENLAIEFKTTENAMIISELLLELELAVNREEWILVQTYIRKYGMRNLSVEKTIELVDIIRNRLSS